MKKTTALLLCGAGLLLLDGTSAEAQARRYVRPPIAKYQPYTSPYLSLFGPGGADFNYFVNTLPQQQFMYQNYNFNRQFREFEGQINADFQKLGQQQIGTGITRTIGTTGHPTSFMNYGTYFRGGR
jgi:hypothetical protein